MKFFNPITASLVIALTAGTAQAATPEFDDMHKQLEIMNNIIKSSVVDTTKSNPVKLSGVDSTYLKGQGIVFTLSSSSRFSGWGDYNFNFVLPDIPDIPDVSFVAPHVSDYHLDVDEQKIAELTTNALEVASESYERAMEAMESQKEGYRDLRDSQRDLQYRLRDIERETRDIEYQLRIAEKDEKEKLISKKKSVVSKKEALEKKSAELSKQALALKNAQEQEREKQLTIRSAYYTKLAESLTDTLCLYGNGLKALPKNESVSIILKSAGDKVKNRYKDKIFVFSKQDINSCSSDKISSSQLLAKGLGYQF